jgi:hypothetical protein
MDDFDMDVDLVHPGILVPSFRKQNKKFTFEFLNFKKLFQGYVYMLHIFMQIFGRKIIFLCSKKTNVDCI